VRFLPRSIALVPQLVIVLVGLVGATTIGLTVVAYSSFVHSLEAAARETVRAAVTSRTQTITELLIARRRSVEGLLASADSLCSEPVDDGRLAWSVDCLRPMVEKFHVAEAASGTDVRYRGRLLVREGTPVIRQPSAARGLARIVRAPDGMPNYQIEVGHGDLRLVADFDLRGFASLFASGIGTRGGAVSLIDGTGQALLVTGDAREPVSAHSQVAGGCAPDSDGLRVRNDAGVESFRATAALPALGVACIEAQIPVTAALAPAESLRAELIRRGVLFAALAAFISLAAAYWIAAPVRRLATSADALRQGKFEHGISVAGPSEVRALGLALRAMATDLDRLITREQMARREAEAADRTKDQFIAMVSHELRTPLSAILGWSELLRTRKLSEDLSGRGLEAIHRSAEAQKRLVDDLLDVSRIATNQLRVATDTVDLCLVVEAVLDSLRPTAVEKQVTIEYVRDGSPLRVRGDAERLQQVVGNLVSNAVKFTPSPGSVRVALERVGMAAQLSVSDTGIGISRDLLPRIFEWFGQGDTASTRRYAGLGLGLGIVKQLVHLHDGEVHAESAGEGRGSTFRVTLPLIDMPASTTEPRAVQTPETAIARKPLHDVRVLLVEDDEDMGRMVRVALESAGAQVACATSAPQAREALRESAPDVLISDIAMPDEDGYSLIRSLRAAGVRVPAIALTAYARHEDAVEAVSAGFQIHIPKPVTPARLIGTVAELALIGHVA
jgi:signal transduction histidine kinase